MPLAWRVDESNFWSQIGVMGQNWDSDFGSLKRVSMTFDGLLHGCLVQCEDDPTFVRSGSPVHEIGSMKLKCRSYC